MKRIGKIIGWSLLGLVLLGGAALAIFSLRADGFLVSFDTEKPRIGFPANQPAILVFSRTTGFRHGESIEASLPAFSAMAKRNHWFIYETEEGGAFNPEQLSRFKAVIFNNSTGRVLSDEQQLALSQYVEKGGALLGIHGAGDNSHKWPWYEQNLLGTHFSHHSLNPQFQTTDVHVEPAADSPLSQHLPSSWAHEDEWYTFMGQPKGVRILAYLDGKTIRPNGNLLFIRDKNFGMGPYHPVAWYRTVGKGKTFYTSMGHSAEVWQKADFVRLVENAIQWAIP